MPEKKQAPTLKTISGLTGLAVPTVSRALSNATDIGLETRKRVQKVAEEIGYVPNRAGVRLRTGRSYVISLVLPTAADVMNLTARLINATASALRGTRYHLTITPVFPDENPLDLVKTIVETRAADGIIINQLSLEDERVRYLMEQEFPFATHGRSKWADQHDYFDFDNYAFAEIAVERLAERNRRNIWMIAPPRNQFYGQEMIRGATKAAKKVGVNLLVIPDVTSDLPSEKIEEAIKTTAATETHPDGIICASSASCLATVSAVEALGMTIAKDIDLYSKEAIPMLNRVRSGILTQHEDAGAAGNFLASAVLKRIEQPDAPLMQKLDVPKRD